MRSLDLTSGRARFLVGEALARALEDLRRDGARVLSMLRAGAGVSLLVLALSIGLGLGDPFWRATIAPLALYVGFTVGVVLFGGRPALRDTLLPLAPLADVLFCFAVVARSMDHAQQPSAVVGVVLGGFITSIVFSVFTLSGVRVALLTVVAWGGEAVLQQRAHMDPGLLVASGIFLGMAGGLTWWSARRMDRLATQLVSEEVARRLAMERGDELEHANARIAQVNAELELQHRKLQQSQEEAETLTSLLVHDMKQPLAAVLALVDHATDDLSAHHPGAAALVDDLGIAREQGHRLLAMVADLLAIARLEKGVLAPKRQPTQVRVLLERVVAAQRWGAPRPTVSLRCDEELVATLDRELVQRLLENLFGNALSFVRPGDHVELSARREGTELVLAVRNSGPAVAPEVRGQLFEKFITRGPRRHNAGLGLYFCRLVAEAHGGRIALVDDPQWSVAFVARLPADAPADTPPTTPRLV